ncbi:phosphatase PAP2 family protein [Pelagibacterium limicola]|uniref:phosphatase PAP2 family protein n=1 Tax=Pelagibacterium limicola TaxID=2791022 RepID=UPI0018B016FE|nr:phosphatase PAP2 family protein [Pelagibacterium limicola]
MFADNTFSDRFWRWIAQEHLSRRIYLRWLPAIVLALLVTAVFFDAPVSVALRNWPAYERAFFTFLTGFGKSDWILIPTLLGMILGFAARYANLTYSWRWAARGVLGVSAYVFTSVALAGLVTVVLKRVIGRARPMYLEQYGTLHIEPFNILDWSMHSFPSGHSTTALAFTVVLITLANGRFARTLTAIGLGIGLSRIVVGDHFLSDVAAGCVVGTLVALLVRDYFATRGWTMRVEGKAVRFRMFAAFLPLLRWLRRRHVPKLFR